MFLASKGSFIDFYLHIADVKCYVLQKKTACFIIVQIILFSFGVGNLRKSSSGSTRGKGVFGVANDTSFFYLKKFNKSETQIFMFVRVLCFPKVKRIPPKAMSRLRRTMCG